MCRRTITPLKNSEWKQDSQKPVWGTVWSIFGSKKLSELLSFAWVRERERILIETVLWDSQLPLVRFALDKVLQQTVSHSKCRNCLRLGTVNTPQSSAVIADVLWKPRVHTILGWAPECQPSRFLRTYITVRRSTSHQKSNTFKFSGAFHGWWLSLLLSFATQWVSENPTIKDSMKHPEKKLLDHQVPRSWNHLYFFTKKSTSIS